MTGESVKYSFQCFRERARTFCDEREWKKFHEPRNLAMALAGECGELSEIFQWKGPLDNGLDKSFNERDVEHIGEEIADVFIYSTRLCDVCNLDLSLAVLNHVKSIRNDTISPASSSYFCSEHQTWNDLKFTTLNDLITSSAAAQRNTPLLFSPSPRDAVLNIHRYRYSVVFGPN